MHDNYVAFLPTINNNYDFAELLSELLGELNASHTGCRYRPQRSGVDQTASLGLLFDPGFEGTGLKVAEVIEQVRHHYVDGDKTSYEDLIYGSLKGLLQNLDSHSQFLDPDMYDDMREDTTGKFGGLGIVIGMR